MPRKKSNPNSSTQSPGNKRSEDKPATLQPKQSFEERLAPIEPTQLTASDRPLTNPNLFTNSQTTRMASALPIWEASSILTQNTDLPWKNDVEGRLYYAKDVGNGQGAIHFWVTENLEDEYPVALAGAAALAVVETFDIRAVCMHLIYAAYATQLDRPWEQDLVIDDRQIEAYLGLKKRTDKNRRAKLALIEELVKQPCRISTFISWASSGKKEMTLEKGRLWHLLGTRYHYQQNIDGNKELIGITFIVRAGLWAKYFLNEEGRKNTTAQYQCGNLPRTLLENVMSLWQHREGAARLMVWLLFKSQFSRRQPLSVQTLMEVAYGAQKVEQARHNGELRKKLANTWDEDLLALHERSWSLHFDLDTYPIEIQPVGFGRKNLQRPRGFFEQLLAARMWIIPEENLITEAAALKELPASDQSDPLTIYEPEPSLTSTQIRAMRTARGWSQRKLSTLSGLSQGLISLIENDERSISPENEENLRQVFQSHL